MKRKLKISINSSSIEILLEIIFIVCPIQIDFSSEKYTLSFENNQFKLNTNYLSKGEIIKFKINNKYEKINFGLKHSITSLEKNTSDEPLINFQQPNEIILKIKNDNKNINQIDCLNCLLIIYIIEKIKITILIESLIISTYFDFYIYDYESKNFFTDKMLIFIPNFEDSCQIDLNFLVSTFGGENIEGTFKISEFFEGISFEKNKFDIKLTSMKMIFL